MATRSAALRQHDDSADPTRAAITTAAHDLLTAEGPAALTVRRLAAEAGMSTMNIYSRFGNKDGVVEELFIDGYRRLAEEMRTAPPGLDPRADLRACCDTYRSFALANPTYYRVMFDREVPGYVPSDTAMRTALDTLHTLADRLQRAMDADIVSPQPPLDAAISVWATCHGLVSLELRGAAPPGTDWASTYDRTLDALLAGLA